MSDVAQIYLDTRERGGASKYNGQETISISITKQQDSSAMDVSDAVKEAIEALEMDDSDLEITIANDTADSIVAVSYTHLDVYKRQAVLLLVGLEKFPLAVETEGLVEKPGASGHVGRAGGVKWLVPGAGEFPAVL